jgi:hypothetical protein
MKRLAINVVLLPPDPVMDLAIEWNQLLFKTYPANILLGKKRYLPHISMAMGCLPADQLEAANALLRTTVIHHHAMELHVQHIRTVDTASGDNVITFDIEHNLELARLHASIVTSLKPLISHDVTEADIDDEPPINPASLDWINRYIPDYCFDNFWPHITLGFGRHVRNFQPFSFQASHLAICHLGNHCTCTKILGEAFLKLPDRKKNSHF